MAKDPEGAVPETRSQKLKTRNQQPEKGEPMVATDSIVVMSSEPTTVDAVAAALGANQGRLGPENICADLRGLAVRLRTAGTEAVLVDVNGNPHKTLAELDGLVRQFHDTTFIVLANEMPSDLLLEAMQVGARHFLTKDSIETQLPGVLERINHAGAPVEPGRLTTVLSACGGVGATTLAINLAWEMQLLSNERVLLMDLDPWANTICRYLGIEPRFGLMNLLERPGRFDRSLVQGDAVAYAEKLSVLGGAPDARMFDAFHFDSERVVELLGVCQEAYRGVVVDLPRVSQSLAGELARRSDAVLVVFQAAVKDIQAARLAIAALVEHGVPPAVIHPILNRHRKRGQMIPMEDIEKALTGLRVVPLSNDYVSTIQAANLGLPLAQAARNSEFRRDIQKLAATLSGSKMKTGAK